MRTTQTLKQWSLVVSALSLTVMAACATRPSTSKSSVTPLNNGQPAIPGMPGVPGEIPLQPVSTETNRAACAMPEALASFDANLVGAPEELVQQMPLGAYRIDQVIVYHRAESATTGEYLGSFIGRVERRAGTHDYDFKYDDCQDAAPASRAFLSTVMFKVPRYIHAPSGYVTFFEPRGSYEKADSNFSTLTTISFDSLRSSSIGMETQPEPGVDFESNQTLTDVLAQLPADRRTLKRADGKEGLEIRFSSEEMRNAETGAALKASMTVLVTYAPETI